ncbi:Zonadhesin [Bienertia sinuspersici]
MEAENFLDLYDSYWFYLDLFKNSINQSFPGIPSSNPEIPTLPTIHTNSPAQKISSNFSPRRLSDYSASPNSVLESPKLQTIFSGKVSEDFEDTKSEKETDSPMKGDSEIQRRRKKKGLSKSLSDLEFEELKGFIDLGFVFSEEDKDSNLVSIIPGLQRLGNKNHTTDNNNSKNSNNDDDDKTAISRPYLSESWGVLEKKRRETYLMNWRVPTIYNQDQMKDNLRFWAHTVASTVR